MAQYLIDFKDDATDESIATYLAENQCNTINMFSRLNKVYHVESDKIPPVTDIVELVQNDDESVIKLLEMIPFGHAQTDVTSDLIVSDDKNWWKIYSIQGVDLSKNETTVSIFGKKVNVYVVDSGIDITHPEFEGADVSMVYSMIPNDFTDNSGHGTAISSVIVGKSCGLTTSSLKVVKIFDKNQPTKQSDMLYALDAILEDALYSSNKVSVVNLSWSIPRNIYIENKIQHLIDAGIFVIAASGNSGVPIDDATPAAMPMVITIGAYGQDFVPSNFSNYTDPTITSLTLHPVNEGELDSWAPGEKIYCAQSSEIGGGYGFTSGTSIAAGIYTAAVAYNFSQYLTSTGELSLGVSMIESPLLSINAYVTTFDRSGLLDLSDSKYSSSNNAICTFKPMKDIFTVNEAPLNPNEFSKMAIRTGMTSILSIWGYGSIGYEIIGDLPNWVTIENNCIIAKPTFEPSTEELIEKFRISYRLYPKLTTTPTVETYIDLYVMGKSFDHTNLPPDDPILDIVLLSNPAGSNNCPLGGGPPCTGFSCPIPTIKCKPTIPYKGTCSCRY